MMIFIFVGYTLFECIMIDYIKDFRDYYAVMGLLQIVIGNSFEIFIRRTC